MNKDVFRKLLNAKSPKARLRAIEELCKGADRAESEFQRLDLFLIPVIDALEREQDAETFEAGCHTLSRTNAHWIWTRSETLKELCSGSPAREEILISVLMRLQLYMDEHLGVEKHFQYDEMAPAIREPEFFALLRNRAELSSEFILFWIQVLQWSFQGKRFTADISASEPLTLVRDSVLLTRLNTLRHRLSRKKTK